MRLRALRHIQDYEWRKKTSNKECKLEPVKTNERVSAELDTCACEDQHDPGRRWVCHGAGRAILLANKHMICNIKEEKKKHKTYPCVDTTGT